LKPDSLLDLSCQVSLMALVEMAVAVRLVGEAGAELLAAHALGLMSKPMQAIAKNLWDEKLRGF